jgi:integrase
MATIKFLGDSAIVSAVMSSGVRFRKVYSKSRCGGSYKRIAQEKYEELLLEIRGLTGPENINNDLMSRVMRRMTVAELAEKYVQEHLSHTRARGNKSYIDSIVAKWGAWPLSQVSNGVVRPWLHSYLEGAIRKPDGDPYSAVYTKKLLRYFQRLFNWGCEADLIADNPLRYVIDTSLKKEFSRRIRPRRQCVSASQLEQILKDAPLWFERICRHAWGTGMRQGEIANLRWDNLPGDGLIYLGSDGTKEADAKVVPMEAAIADQIEAIRLEQEIEGKSDYVYLGVGGKPIAPIQISDSWRHYRDKAGLSNLRFHDLRRSYQNRKEKEGHSLRAIAAALGHHSTDTTARHYRSVSEAELRRLSTTGGV